MLACILTCQCACIIVASERAPLRRVDVSEFYMRLKRCACTPQSLNHSQIKAHHVPDWVEGGSLVIGQQGIINQHATPSACLFRRVSLHMFVCACSQIPDHMCGCTCLHNYHQVHPYCSLISAQCVGGTQVSPVAHFPTDKCRSSSENEPHLLCRLPPSTHFPCITAQQADLHGWSSL